VRGLGAPPSGMTECLWFEVLHGFFPRWTIVFFCIGPAFLSHQSLNKTSVSFDDSGGYGTPLEVLPLPSSILVPSVPKIWKEAVSPVTFLSATVSFL